MPDINTNNKRIIKNTVFMYIRMFLVMCVSLFTVRVVFAALGEVDYGINNAVGGVVSMFGFLSSTMAAASLRFFSFYIGRKEYDTLSRYFSVTFWSYVVLVTIAVVFAETIGLWFVQTKLVIPTERLTAAVWVYQCVVVTFVVDILLIPFNAIILAREKMNLYAYIGVVEAVAKLLIAFAIKNTGGDSLILFAILSMLTSLLVALFYILYDFKYFPESRIRKIWDKCVFKEVFSFSSWSIFGSLALMFRSQGINILLNIFFGPIVNAARAIAYQVDNALLNLVNGYYQAVRPQLTKYYSTGEEDKMILLANRSSRLCFYLFYLFTVPFIIETPYILNLWLGEVPEMTVLFTRLVLINSVIESLATPFKGVITATGKIKWNELINGAIRLLNFPVAWVFLKMGYPPEITLYIAIISGLLCHVIRLIISSRLTIFSFSSYFGDVIVPVMVVSILVPIAPVFVYYSIDEHNLRFIMVLFSSVVSSFIIMWQFGLKKNEREQLLNWMKSRIGLVGVKE